MALMVLALEHANEAVTARSSVEPKGDRVVRRVIPRFKEPEKAVNILGQVDEACIGVDTRGGFADTLFPRLLVGDVCPVWTDDGLDSGRSCGKLSW